VVAEREKQREGEREREREKKKTTTIVLVRPSKQIIGIEYDNVRKSLLAGGNRLDCLQA